MTDMDERRELLESVAKAYREVENELGNLLLFAEREVGDDELARFALASLGDVELWLTDYPLFHRSERLPPSMRLHSGLQALDRQSVPQRSASPLASVADLA